MSITATITIHLAGNPRKRIPNSPVPGREIFSEELAQAIQVGVVNSLRNFYCTGSPRVSVSLATPLEPENPS